MLIIASVVVNAQTWDFNNSVDGWKNIGIAQKKKANHWELTTKDGFKNPGLEIEKKSELQKVDVNAVSILAVTLKNLSEVGPSELKAITSTDKGKIYLSSAISKGDKEFKTYYFDYTRQSAKWKGNVKGLKLLFKSGEGKNFVGSGDEKIIIDKIEFIKAIPKTEKNSYTFDNDSEGFMPSNASITCSPGVVKFTPKVGRRSKFEQTVYHYVDATNKKIVKINLINKSSANNQLKFMYRLDDGTVKTLSKKISTSDSKEKTYKFDLSKNTNWTGKRSFSIAIGNDSNGKTKDAGTIIFNSIIFE